MGFLKKSNADMVTPRVDASKWYSAVGTKSVRSKTASETISKYDPSKWLLSHVTIMASVDVELADPKDPKSAYLIKPEHSIFVNNNGDCWERELLTKTYKTFIGANNYVEHIQIPENSRGKVVDAALREIDLGIDAEGNKCTTLYVDLLIATSWEYPDTCQKILNGEYNAVSMGCFLAGTEITMGDGTKLRIEDVCPGDSVITHTGKISTVVNTQVSTKKEEVYKLSFEGDYKPIFVTKEHPFFAISRNIKCACGCGENVYMRFLRKTDDFTFYPYIVGHHTRVKNPMDKAKISLKTSYTPTPEWIETKDLAVGDFLSYPTTGTVVDDPNSSVEKARLLGYFAAEGSYIKEPVFSGTESDYAITCQECGHLFNNLGTHVHVHGISWKEYLIKYPGSVNKANKPLSIIRGGRKASHEDIGLERSYKVIGLEFSLGKHEYETLNKEIAELATVAFPGCTVLRYDDIVKIIGQAPVEYMKEYCGEYSDRKQLSPKVIRWPTELQKHVIATWFIGDYACTVSKHMSDQFRVLLNRCSVRFNTYKTTAKDYITKVKGKTYAGKKRESYLHQINTLGMEILSPYLTYAFEFKNKKLKPVYHGSTGYASYDKGYMLRQIKSIEKLEYEGLVYNFEVEGDNSYIANDVAVHNCLIQYSTCSRCGKTAKDETEQCEHVKYYRKNSFFDANGKKRIVAEICGHKDDPSSVTFIDASWVRKPAFPGAVLRNIVSPKESIAQNIELNIAKGKDPLLDSIKDREVILTEHHDVEAFGKSAHQKAASDKTAEGEDARFGDPAKEPPAEEAPPAAEAPADPAPATDEAFPEPGAPAEDPAATPAPDAAPTDAPADAPADPAAPATTPDEAKATPLGKIKDEVLDNVLTQVKQQLIDQVKGMISPPSAEDQVGANALDYNSLTRSSDSLVKEASEDKFAAHIQNISSRKNARYLQDKYSVDVTTIKNVKLASALLATASVHSMKEIASLGFTRKDAAEVLHFVDSRRNGSGISREIISYVARNKMASQKSYLINYMVDTVRRPSPREASALVSWAGILKDFS